MATKQKRRVVTEGQAKQAEDVLRYLYNKGEGLMRAESYSKGGELQNGADVLRDVLAGEGINCACRIGDKSQRIRRWNCSCRILPQPGGRGLKLETYRPKPRRRPS